ncbi:bifunctional diguanylate cyclase/phosphodiesterase [Clostridium tyrobutyricum]|uniref:bifunctional diguanylate cyclase/phosphodiesterase n=1 Tax=Clostridium tyrobutyricum TaxID=1519 RepID=UPI001C3D7538|nr:GGDEF and EAL domain-containing protein [Clostridium tyrobutyricum]MBV4436164.1 GGDEF and EAL domain-containing protein [Clostridium tyrobutyricum]
MSLEEKKFILDNINTLAVKWNPENNKFYISKIWENITGYNINPNANFFNELIKVIYPDDIKIIDNCLMKFISEYSKNFQCEYRIITKSQKIKWVLHKGRIFSDNKRNNSIINYISDITDKKIYESELEYLKYYDEITNIPNRSLLAIKLNRFINEDHLSNRKIAVFSIDIDNFEKINDVYKEKVVHSLLRKVASILKGNLEFENILCKLEGSKFCIVIFDYGNVLNIKLKAEKFLGLFNRLFNISEEKIFVTVCIGIFLCTKSVKDIEKVFKYSNIALNNAKRNGINKYEIYNKEMNIEILNNMKIENELRMAILNKEFVVYYQPQVDIYEKKIYGVEALIRWNHPSGMRLPNQFIDIVEKNGMINEIGKFVLYESCIQMKKMKSLGYKDVHMSVNISKMQLEDKGFVSYVISILNDMKIDPKYLCFEITERIVVEKSKSILKVLFEIKNIGIKIFIDDFGTKYSSLNYLTYLPVDGIKLDKSFIDSIKIHKKHLIIINHIVDLSRDLNIDIVAEGVETHKQLTYLKSIKCNKIQGFIFSKPLNALKLNKILKDGSSRGEFNIDFIKKTF